MHLVLCVKYVQWSLRIKETLGPDILSFVGRVVLFLEVQNALVLWNQYFEEYPLQSGRPFLGGSFTGGSTLYGDQMAVTVGHQIM